MGRNKSLAVTRYCMPGLSHRSIQMSMASFAQVITRTRDQGRKFDTGLRNRACGGKQHGDTGRNVKRVRAESDGMLEEALCRKLRSQDGPHPSDVPAHWPALDGARELLHKLIGHGAMDDVRLSGRSSGSPSSIAHGPF